MRPPATLNARRTWRSTIGSNPFITMAAPMGRNAGAKSSRFAGPLHPDAMTPERRPARRAPRALQRSEHRAGVAGQAMDSPGEPARGAPGVPAASVISPMGVIPASGSFGNEPSAYDTAPSSRPLMYTGLPLIP